MGDPGRVPAPQRVAEVWKGGARTRALGCSLVWPCPPGTWRRSGSPSRSDPWGLCLTVRQVGDTESQETTPQGSSCSLAPVRTGFPLPARGREEAKGQKVPGWWKQLSLWIQNEGRAGKGPRGSF